MASSSQTSQSFNDGQHKPSPSSLPDPLRHQRQFAPRPSDDPDSDEERDSDADHDAPDQDQDQDEHGGRLSRKRKRPMSVSCELCKQRKVKCELLIPRLCRFMCT